MGYPENRNMKGVTGTHVLHLTLPSWPPKAPSVPGEAEVLLQGTIWHSSLGQAHESPFQAPPFLHREPTGISQQTPSTKGVPGAGQCNAHWDQTEDLGTKPQAAT